MTEERAREIVQKVIYANVIPLPEIKDSVDAFRVGMMLGKIQKQLEIELGKEVSKGSEN